MSYSLLIPVYNEEPSLKKLLPQLKHLDQRIEIIIINDGSTDGTKSILEKNDDFTIINSSQNQGKGTSILKGVKLAKSDSIILMDGDLEIDLKSIDNLIKDYESNNKDVITGSRWNEKSNPGTNINTYGNHLINYIFNLLYSTNFTDVLCCVKIMKKELFSSLMLKSKGFNIEMEIMTKLVIKNITISEKDVVYNRRSNDRGKKLKLSDSWGIIWEMFKNKYNYVG